MTSVELFLTWIVVLYPALGVHGIECQEGWITHEESCYHFSTDKQSWFIAEVMCETYDGHLAEIDTQSEDTFLLNMVTSINNGSFWVGATDLGNDGEWLWNTSDTEFDYTNWADGEPNDSLGPEDCVDLKPGIDGWNDENCQHVVRYICEQSMPNKSVIVE